MIKVGNNLKIVDNKYLESKIDVRKEGLLLLINYYKGDEKYILLYASCVIDGKSYDITEVNQNNIVKWKRRFIDSGNYVCSIRLPLVSDKVKFYIKSDKDIYTNTCLFEIEIEYNFWDKRNDL